MKSTSVLPILMHHHISPEKGLVTVSPQHFEEQLKWLSEKGWTTVGCKEIAHFLKGQPLPEKSCVLTFDDGYLDNWVYAHPLLERYQMKAVLFLATAWIGEGEKRPYAGMNAPLPATPRHTACKQAIEAGYSDEVMLRWSEVKAMEWAGTFEFHSHTHTHTRWDQILADKCAREEALKADLMSSQTHLKAQLGHCSTHLCWPQGYYDADYLKIGQAVGFKFFHTTHHGSTFHSTSPLHLPRIVIKNKGVAWFSKRMQCYGSPWLSRFYTWLKRH